MFSNRLTFGALAVACIAAAGVGGYFASRQNTVPAPVAAEQALSTAAAPTLEGAVQETEAVVEESAERVDAAPRPAAAAPVTAAGTPRRTPAAAPRPAPAAARPDPPALERSWPTSTASPPQTTSIPGAPASQAPSPAPGDTVSVAPIEDFTAFEPPRAPEPPLKVFDELVVSPNSVIGLQTETRISSETARIEDRVEAKVTRDVKVGDAIAIPAGSRAIGSVIQIERGGKFKERARLGIRFNTLVLADGTRMPMSTETIYREGEAPGNSSAAKIGGGAVGGAILGAILGGAKGAAIGATAGAGGGVAVVQAGDASEVTLPAGSPLTVRLLTPLTVTVEQQ